MEEAIKSSLTRSDRASRQEEKDNIKLARKIEDEVEKEKKRFCVMEERGLKRSKAQSSSTRVVSKRSRLANFGMELDSSRSPHPMGSSTGETSADPGGPGVGRE